MKSDTEEILAGKIFRAAQEKPGILSCELAELIGKSVTSLLTKMSRYGLLSRVKTHSQKPAVAKKNYVQEYHAIGRHFSWPDKKFRLARDSVFMRRRPAKTDPDPVADIKIVDTVTEIQNPLPPLIVKEQLSFIDDDAEKNNPCPRAGIIAMILALPFVEVIRLLNELDAHIAEILTDSDMRRKRRSS